MEYGKRFIAPMKANEATDLPVLGVPVHCGDVRSLADLIDIGRYPAVFVLCDVQTYRHCWPALSGLDWKNEPAVIVIAEGEQTKTLDTCRQVWEALVTGRADRHSLLINLGGGVVTDLGGFCAATYMRGIDFVHIPTTVLAMTDAAIGGKHGVDFAGYKNYIGLFVQPAAIIVDTAFLHTLPQRQLRNGLAEVIKHGAIGDRDILACLERHDIHSLPWPELIAQSIRVKKHFVERDPLEKGVRAALNFGHSVGHAIESTWLGEGSSALHGEAIALGMRAELALSKVYCHLAESDAGRIGKVIDRYLPGLAFPQTGPEPLIETMMRDKKNVKGELRLALLKAIEQPVTGCVLTREQLGTVLSPLLTG